MLLPKKLNFSSVVNSACPLVVCSADGFLSFISKIFLSSLEDSLLSCYGRIVRINTSGLFNSSWLFSSLCIMISPIYWIFLSQMSHIFLVLPMFHFFRQHACVTKSCIFCNIIVQTLKYVAPVFLKGPSFVVPTKFISCRLLLFSWKT